MNKNQEGVIERLAVIESRLDTLIEEVSAVREHIPGEMVEHSQRISVLERGMRAMQWVAGLFATAMIGAFVGHVMGGK